MATSEGIPSSIDIEFLELNDNPYNKDDWKAILGEFGYYFEKLIKNGKLNP